MGSAVGQGVCGDPQGLDPTIHILPTCWGETWVLSEHPHLCWQCPPDHSWTRAQGPFPMGSTRAGIQLETQGRSGDPHAGDSAWTEPSGRWVLGQVSGCLLSQAGPGFDLSSPTRSLLTWGGMPHVKGRAAGRAGQGEVDRRDSYGSRSSEEAGTRPRVPSPGHGEGCDGGMKAVKAGHEMGTVGWEGRGLWPPWQEEVFHEGFGVALTPVGMVPSCKEGAQS